MWGWLGQLGNGLKKVGTGIKDNATKLTHLGGDPDGSAGVPGAEMPTPTYQRPQMPAPGSVGAGFDPGASHLSTSVNVGDIPNQVERPALPPAQYVRPRPDQAGAGAMWAPPPALAPGPDPSNIASPVFTRQTGPTREQTPVPQLPGHPGDPRPYDPVIAGKYDFVMSHARRNEDGSYLDPSDKQHGGGFKRDWKSIGKNFALGARQSVNQTMRNNPHASTGAILGSALGGGLGGGATATISPQMGYENEFDQMHAPQMEADQQRVFTRGQQQHQQDQQSADLEYKRTMTKKAEHDMQSEKARDRYLTIPGGGIYDTQDQYFVREPTDNSKPQIRNVVDTDGKARTYAIYPDGRQEYLGDSEKALLNTQNNSTRTNIAAGHDATSVRNTDARQAGANGRTAATQAGINSRAAAKSAGASAGAGKRQLFVSKAVDAGYSKAEAEAEANRRGLR